jgi:hypothetical protein
LTSSKPTSQLNPEGGVDAGYVVAAHAVHTECGQPVLRGSNEMLLHLAAARVQLGQRDDIAKAAVVTRELQGRAEQIELEPLGSAIMPIGTRGGLAISGAGG